LKKTKGVIICSASYAVMTSVGFVLEIGKTMVKRLEVTISAINMRNSRSRVIPGLIRKSRGSKMPKMS
jgi:hypothetical protein